MKCVTDVVESSASVEIDPQRLKIILPDDFVLPADGLNIRWPDPPLVQEARLLDYKFYAALAYVRANKLDRVEIDSPNARFGIMTGGKAYLGRAPGADRPRPRRRNLLAPGNPPVQGRLRLAARGARRTCVRRRPAGNPGGRGKSARFSNTRSREELYNLPDSVRPRVYGKFDEKDGAGGEWSVPMGNWLLPAHYELSPAIIAKAIAKRLDKFDLPADVRARIATRITLIEAKERALAKPRVAAERKPWFCSGCPHNTSTQRAGRFAGDGRHRLPLHDGLDGPQHQHLQPDGRRRGGLGRGKRRSPTKRHVFTNLGDGPTSIPACWRSARRSPRRSTSPTRYSTTMRLQ